VAEPEFASIEEWLGANTADYYRVLAHTGGGGWHPERDAALWVTFNLRAHHMQAQTLRSRYQQAMAMWEAIEQIRSTYGLPERMDLALYEAALGYRIRRSTYIKRTEVEGRTASRDLKAFVDHGLLRAVGETRGRHYVAGPALEPVLAARRQSRTPVSDPYSWVPERLARPVPHSYTEELPRT
jgi:Fic family protein